MVRRIVFAKQEDIDIVRIQQSKEFALRDVDHEMVAVCKSNIHLLQPVTVWFDTLGGCWLIDGVQRFTAHRELGRKKIRCMVIEGDIKTAKLHSLVCNCKHGKPPQKTERIEILKSLLQDSEWQTFTDRCICKIVGLALDTVRAERRKLGTDTNKIDCATMNQLGTNQKKCKLFSCFRSASV